MMDAQKPDWQQIELDYRAGIKPLRLIASEHDLSEGAIRKRAKRDDWTRDLSERIQAKADQLVRNAEVRSEVRTSLERTATERQMVEACATAVADVRLAHRKDIHRARSIAMRLFDELECQVGPENAAMLSQLGELMRREDDKGQDKLGDLYSKIISLPERSKTMKSLADSLKVCVDLERQAFGMDAKGAEPSGDNKARIAIELVQPSRRDEDDE